LAADSVDNFFLSEKNQRNFFEEKKRGKTRLVFPQTPLPKKGQTRFARLANNQISLSLEEKETGTGFTNRSPRKIF
jgi:hypothetical protein